MRIEHLAILYVLVGAGCAIALAMKKRPTSAIDAVMLMLFWPLFAPYALSSEREREAEEMRAQRMGFADDDLAEEAEDLLDALRRAGGAPLASLLPDVETGTRLAQRLATARARVLEIDELLSRERFDERAALARQSELRERGDDKAADMVEGRLQIIRRMRAMRDRWSAEIDTISELLTQLEIQAELVRLSGMSEDGTRELVGELVSRIQGLDDFLEMEL